jgi:hypothetical protein
MFRSSLSHGSVARRIGALIVVMVLTACGSGGGGGNDAGVYNGPDLWAHGRVSGSSGSGQGSALSGADVVVTVDRNGNGLIDGGESSATTTDSDGAYSLTTAASEGDRVVVSIRSEGYAPQFRTLVAGPYGEALFDVTLTELEPLECDAAGCALEGRQLVLEGLPEGFGGSAAVFNPVAQADAFPGGFEERDGAMLISGVFASVALTDDSGDPVTTLSAPATVRMAVPTDTWGIIVDMDPGTDRIEVPLYSFDEEAGTWDADGSGHLVDGDGALIPESDLAAIRALTYSGTVSAEGEVTHFSYWNVDWPVESHGCVSGVVVDSRGAPVPGATVTLRGVSYNGASTPAVTAADGSFCIEVMRSEGAGEDVDQDGVTGETQTVSVRVVNDGKVYDMGNVDIDVAAGTCGGNCTDAGELRLTAANELDLQICTISGTVRDVRGTPIAGALVVAWDDFVESEELLAVCGTALENCVYTAVSGLDGSFTVSTALFGSLTLWGNATTQVDATRSAFRYGQRWSPVCPEGALNFTLDEGYDTVTLTVTATGNTISWTPNDPATWLAVDSGGDIKWMVSADMGNFTGPVTFGAVPAGTTQVFPTSLSPAPLASGDEISVWSQYTSADGYPVISTGTGTVP